MTVVETLENGLTLLFEHRSGPGFALELRLPTGAAHDGAGREGAAALLEEWLHKGAGTRGARALANAFDELGLRRGGGVTHEDTRFTVSGLTADLRRALDLIADTVRRPALPEGELAVIVDLARQDLEALADNPAELLGTALRAKVFAPPYAHSVGGTLGALEAMTPEDVRALHALYGPRGAALALVADLEASEASDLAQEVFGDWRGGGATLPPAVFRGALYGHLPGESAQTHLNLIFPGVGPAHPDWLAFHLALSVLSGGSASRLFEAVREERGLAYSVGASVATLGREGFAWAFAGSTPERAQETLDVILSEFARLREGATPGEFERARAGLLAATVFGAESARGRAAALARDWLTLGRARPPGEVRAGLRGLTLADLNAFLASFASGAPAVMTLGGAALKMGGVGVPA